MAEYTALAPLFTDIANAIRSKTGETGAITANSFPDKINSVSSTPEHGEINLGESRANSIVIGKQYSTLYFFVVQGCYPMASDNLSSSTDFDYPIVGRYYQNNNMYLLTLQRTAYIATKRNGQILPIPDLATYENGIITFKSKYCIFYTFNWSIGQPKWEIIVHWIGW